MAIDLPPVLPPVQADQATMQAANRSSAIEGRVGQIDVRVVGNQHLSRDEVSRIIAESEKPSEVVTRLLSAYYTDGHLLMDIKYFRRGNVVTAVVSQKTLSEVRGPQQARQHFSSLEGDSDLTVAEFDRARVMADVQARRAGVNYSISYEEAANNGVVMVLTPKPVENHDATDLILELNNKGSRYLGRYFGSVGAQHDFKTGARLAGSYQTAFADWGESVDGESLDQFAVSFDQPTRFGLYGAELTYMEYERSPNSSRLVSEENCPLLGLPIGCTTTTTVVSSSETLDAEVLRAALTGEQVLYSTPQRRITLNQRLEYVDSILEQSGVSGPLMEEKYGAVDFGVRYTLRSSEKGKSALSARLNLKAGFAGDGTLDSYDEFETAYLAANPGASEAPDVTAAARQSEFLRLRPEAVYQHRLFGKTVATLTAKAQFSDVQLPQQQQFVLGGMNTMSAYLPGVLVGDEGYYFKADVATKWKMLSLDWQPSVFIEHGAASFQDASSALGDEQSVTDAGIRLDLSLGKDLKTEFVAAMPIQDDVIDDDRLESLEADFYWRVRLEL